LELLHVHFTTSLAPRAGSDRGRLPRLPSVELVLLLQVLLLLLLVVKGAPAVEVLIVPAPSDVTADGHTSTSHAGHGCRATLGPGRTGIGTSMLAALPRERLAADHRVPGASPAAAAAVNSDPAVSCVACLLPLVMFLTKDLSLPANASCNIAAEAQMDAYVGILTRWVKGTR
jgi:hypothetical protein